MNEIIEILKGRFEKHPNRHVDVSWSAVENRLNQASSQTLKALEWMEQSGGEPDVLRIGGGDGTITFVDFSKESPIGRRSLCYDEEALASRKQHKPSGSALGQAESFGLKLLNENLYRQLQSLTTVDTKTSSWIHTPDEIRRLGGALFGDHRYGQVFVYHNGAESYYAARGYRVFLSI